MFRSPSRRTPRCMSRILAFAAPVALLITLLVAPAARAQFHTHRETNANRRARIERQIQDTYTHRFEVAGGGGYLRFRSGQFTQKNNEVDFFLNTTYFFNEKLGATAEVRGYYGRAKILNGLPFNENSLIGYPQISEYPFMVGPTYRVYLHQHIGGSIFALGGTAIGKFDGDTKGRPSQSLGLWPSATVKPAFSVGANIDINLFPNLAFRIAPNYMGTTFGGSLQNNLGVNIGAVYRFGRQK
ncbi:MAG TPA: hypothetical protein VN678_11440 [Acidobacteriaceae bacterium]|nr:hypothetical protein [Acidobacteriaceae bacterium]